MPPQNNYTNSPITQSIDNGRCENDSGGEVVAPPFLTILVFQEKGSNVKDTLSKQTCDVRKRKIVKGEGTTSAKVSMVGDKVASMKLKWRHGMDSRIK